MALERIDLIDLNDLRKAKILLENPGIAAKITHMLGTPIEKGFEMLPKTWHAKVGEITQAALLKAFQVAVATLKEAPGQAASNHWHKIAVATSGGLGGFFGLTAITLELPISTTIMLRSIADIARSEGELLGDVAAHIACIEVFALGGPQRRQEGAETGYFATRMALARSIGEAAEHLTRKGLTDKGAPALVRLIVKIAERFSLQVSEKAAAQAIPAIGAAGGALINALFIDHFQDMARGHFIVRRLEKKYGREPVKAAYESLSMRTDAPPDPADR